MKEVDKSSSAGTTAEQRTEAQNQQVSQPIAKPNVSGSFSVGMKFPMINGGYLKIMAFVDGYYMARFKGCVPFCCKQDELIRRMLTQNSR